MNIGLSEITRSFRSRTGALSQAIPHGHAQQLLVAAIGHKTLASYQAAKASEKEPQNFNQIRHIVLDRAGLTQRAAELGVEYGIDQLSRFLVSAFSDRLAGVVLHNSYSDMDDYIRKQITLLVESNGRVIGEMAQLNHDGLDEVYFDLEIVLDQIQVGKPLSENIAGNLSLNQDTERPYTGTTIDFWLSLTVERLGKRCYSAVEYEMKKVVAREPWGYDQDDDGEPPVRTKAQVIAELLGWSVNEVDVLQDVEETPLDGSSGEMIYGYLIDFTDYASPEVATRIMREHGTLQFTVGPDFFDGVRYDGWPH